MNNCTAVLRWQRLEQFDHIGAAAVLTGFTVVVTLVLVLVLKPDGAALKG